MMGTAVSYGWGCKPMPHQLEWHEACLPKPRHRQVTKVVHYYYMSVNALSACLPARSAQAGNAQAGMTRPYLPAGRCRCERMKRRTEVNTHDT